jgi:hypothetical protein
MLSHRALLLATLCGVCGASGMAIGAGQIVHPSGRPATSPQVAQPSATRWKTERVRVNGVRLEVREATVPAEHALLSARLSALWRVGEPGGAMQASGLRPADATLIGRQRGDRHEVIRLQSMTPGLTRVVVSSLDLSRAATRVPDLPIPPARGISVLTVIESDGPPGETTFILQGPRDASIAAPEWVDRLRIAGWTTLRSYDGRRRVGGDEVGQVHWAHRGAEQLEVVVLRHGAATRWVVRVSRHAP